MVPKSTDFTLVVEYFFINDSMKNSFEMYMKVFTASFPGFSKLPDIGYHLMNCLYSGGANSWAYRNTVTSSLAGWWVLGWIWSGMQSVG